MHHIDNGPGGVSQFNQQVSEMLQVFETIIQGRSTLDGSTFTSGASSSANTSCAASFGRRCSVNMHSSALGALTRNNSTQSLLTLSRNQSLDGERSRYQPLPEMSELEQPLLAAPYAPVTEQTQTYAAPIFAIGDASVAISSEETANIEDLIQWRSDMRCNLCQVMLGSAHSLVNPRHHCRVCARAVCGNCSATTQFNEHICADCYFQQKSEGTASAIDPNWGHAESPCGMLVREVCSSPNQSQVESPFNRLVRDGFTRHPLAS